MAAQPSATLASFPGGFPALFDTYGAALADHVARAFPPQYRLDLPHGFVERARALGRAPFPSQLHAAAALVTRLQHQPGAFLNGEASVGKTQVALTASALLGAQRVLIVAASNLLPQWADEIRAVLPQARIFTDIDSLSRLEQVLQILRDSAMPCFVLLARDQAKLGGPWRASAAEVAAAVPDKKGAVQLPYCLSCQRALLRVLIRPAHVLQAFAMVPVSRLAPGVIAYCPTCQHIAMSVDVPEETSETWFACNRCRGLLATIHVTKKKDPNTQQIVELPTTIEPWTRTYLESGRRACPHCHDTAWQSTRSPHGRAKTSIARYLARRHPRAFDLLIADELQDGKEQGTAQGMMLTDLVRASRRAIGATATLCGGKPGTVFYLLHRLLPAFRRAWPYSAETRFARAYGLVETMSEEHERQHLDSSGRFTKKKTVKRTTRELPGINPEILRYILDSTVFLALRDLGVSMPPYTEEAIEIPLLPAQQRAYDALVAALAPHLKAGLRQRRMRTIGAALQALLTYPDQPFRGEAVTNPKTGDLVASAPALDPAVQYPKEQDLLARCRQQTQRGRRTIVYVTHTDRRDITPRLLAVLQEGGLRAEVLRAETVSPRHRGQWVRTRAPQLDVLITHPKLVGTGLNIPEFHTIIWYEPDLSAYTLRQASRRTWRIGQEHAVEVYFLIYSGTAQQAALALVSRKILASLLVEGQVETGHAIATYDAGGEIFYELAKAVLGHTEVADIHETLRTLSRTQAQARELCDPALAAKTALPTLPPPAAPLSTPRRRRISITAPVAAEQTALFALA